MKKIKNLTPEILVNLSATIGNSNSQLLKVLTTEINGAVTNITVARIFDEDTHTLAGNLHMLLIYIDGYCGVLYDIAESKYQPSKSPMELIEEGDELFLIINPQCSKVYPQITYNETRKCYGYGGYIDMKEEFVRVDHLDHNNPVVLYFPALKAWLQEVITLSHPNLIIDRYKTRSLICINEDGSDGVNLSDDWIHEVTQDREELRKIVDQAESPKEVKRMLRRLAYV